MKAKRHAGTELLIPEEMSSGEAEILINQLVRLESRGEEKIHVSRMFPYTFTDGAHAFMLAIEEMFGEALHNVQFDPRGNKILPEKKSIEIGPGETILVPVGEFSLPGIEGEIMTSRAVYRGLIVFELNGFIKEKDLDTLEKLIELTQKKLEEKSIYKAKALKVSLRDGDGDIRMAPGISFMDPNQMTGIFNEHLTASIDSEVLLPIRYPIKAKEIMGGSLKRGVLLAGAFGTGKTLTAVLVAREAVENGWTFIYLANCQEIPEALEFARIYSPAVIFAEDIDLAVSGARTKMVNEIFNSLDGVDSKKDEIITIMTTNNVDEIHPAMKRPGRIDSIIVFDLPDKNTASDIVKMHGGDDVVEMNMGKVGELLQNNTPAVIVETIKRARLRALNRSDGGDTILDMEDIENAYHLILNERNMLGDRRSPNGAVEKTDNVATEKVA